MTSPLAQLLRLAGYVPLAAYPAVLIANAMQASALLESRNRGDAATPQRALMSLFVGGTTLYPLVVVASTMMARNARGKAEVAWSALPLAFAGALAVLFALLERAERRE